MWSGWSAFAVSPSCYCHYHYYYHYFPVKMCGPLSILQREGALPLYFWSGRSLSWPNSDSLVAFSWIKVSGLGTCVSTVPQKKAIFEVWEHKTAEMAGLGTAFLCVPAHFNPWERGGAHEMSTVSLMRNAWSASQENIDDWGDTRRYGRDLGSKLKRMTRRHNASAAGEHDW